MSFNVILDSNVTAAKMVVFNMKNIVVEKSIWSDKV